MSIISRKIDGMPVEQRRKDGYINATQLCKIHNTRTGENKIPADWLQTKTAKSALNKLSVTTNIVVVKLVEKIEGKKGGTWIHPRLAVRFTMWLDDDFSLLVEDLVQQWMTQSAAQKAVLSPWGKVRLEGKETRREFTDAIKDYIERHPELPDDAKEWMYANASDKVNLVVFGRTAKQLLRDFSVGDRTALRNAFNSKELQLIREVENVAMRLTDSRDIHPFRAVQEAESRLLIPVSSRALLN